MSQLICPRTALAKSGEMAQYVCVQQSEIFRECVWQVRVVLPALLDGRREEAGEERQKQIFCLSHLLGGDPEEASLHRLQEALEGKPAHAVRHCLLLSNIFSDNRQYSRPLRRPHITLHVVRCP